LNSAIRFEDDLPINFIAKALKIFDYVETRMIEVAAHEIVRELRDRK